MGVNWYWRSNFKFMLNYVMVDRRSTAARCRPNVEDNPNIIEAACSSTGNATPLSADRFMGRGAKPRPFLCRAQPAQHRLTRCHARVSPY